MKIIGFIVFIIIVMSIVLVIGLVKSEPKPVSVTKPRSKPKPKPEPGVGQKPSPPESSGLFINDYPLVEFVKLFGSKMQIGTHTKNGKAYRDCRFINSKGMITKVRFFSQLGELTKEEIKDRKDELYVGKMESGKYYLHDERVKPWETVDLDA